MGLLGVGTTHELHAVPGATGGPPRRWHSWSWLRRLLIGMSPVCVRFDASGRNRSHRCVHAFAWTRFRDRRRVRCSYRSGRRRDVVVLSATDPGVSKLPVATEQGDSGVVRRDLSGITINIAGCSAVLLVILCVAVPGCERLVRKGQSLHWGLITGGIVVTSVAMALLHFPYRMLYFTAIARSSTVSWERHALLCHRIARRRTGCFLPRAVATQPHRQEDG